MSNKVKLFAFTDSHASNSIIKRVKVFSKNSDLIVCCGDFTIFGKNSNSILKEFDSFEKPFVIIHGNHESMSEIKKLSKSYKNIKYIHGNSFLFKNIEFFGYGGDGFSLKNEEFVEISKEFLIKMRNNYKKGIANVLITHGPPYGTKLDDLYQNDFCGNKDYRTFIEKAPLSLSLCGHIHENFGKHDYINNKIIINPGQKGKKITLELE